MVNSPCKPECPNRSATCHCIGQCEAFEQYLVKKADDDEKRMKWSQEKDISARYAMSTHDRMVKGNYRVRKSGKK